jgi:hypothetical protein
MLDKEMTPEVIIYCVQQEWKSELWNSIHIIMIFNFSCISYHISFVGAFAKFHKARINFHLSVYPYVYLPTRNNSAPTGRIFMRFDIWVF